MLGDLAPPRHDDPSKDCTDTVATYVLYVDSTSKLHRVNLFVASPREVLWMAVNQHRSRKKVVAILLAQTLEGIVAIAP